MSSSSESESQTESSHIRSSLRHNWNYIPRILEADWDGVFINRTAPYPNEQEARKSFTWKQDKVETNKLTVHSYGDFELAIGVLRMENFDRREDFDRLFLSTGERLNPAFRDKLSIEDALKFMSVRINVKRRYFLENEDELEKLLGRRVDRECLAIKENEDVNEDESEDVNEQPSLVCQEIFYKLMVELFGEPTADESDDRDEKQEGVYEKALMVREFHMLFNDGNCLQGTARRGSYYILFLYYTS